MEQMRGQRQEFNSLRPEVHDVHRRWREVADSYDPPRLLVGETFVEHLDDLVPFLSDDQLHLDFNIPFAHVPFEADVLRDMIERTRGGAPRPHAGLGRQQPRHLALPDPLGGRRSRPRAVRAHDAADAARHGVPVRG